MFAALNVRRILVLLLALGLAATLPEWATKDGTCLAAGSSALPPAATTEPEVVHLPADFDFPDSVTALRVEWPSLDGFYQLYATATTRGRPANSYGLALADLTMGLFKKDPAAIEKAEALFAADAASKSAVPREKDADRLGSAYAEEILSGKYPAPSSAPESVKPVVYVRRPRPTNDFHTIVIGRSAIHLPHNAKVKTQADRVSRDWQLGRNVANPPWAVSSDLLCPWTEGLRIKKLIDLADARVSCVWGTKVRKIGEKWYAPDWDGAPRFEVSPDKVIDYPTTIYLDDRTAILNDTHGISAIAWDCRGADLALGCGDYPGKMDAAFYLAQRGVNVYFPTDRYIGMLMGVQTKGTLIGSGPIEKSGDGAIIGDQPIAIDVSEPIVVSDSHAGYPLRYYDTPRRYFEALSAYCGKPLNMTPVEVKDYGHAEVVVAEARKLGVKLIGIRVKSRGEHDAVAAWLKEDPARRVVLFHSAAYPDGSKLFQEFPKQTSFGDINPQFE